MSSVVTTAIRQFFECPPEACGSIINERALQLELGYYFRTLGWRVRFELPYRLERLPGSTLKPKFNLDLLIETDDISFGIELKVPLNGQHPETIYSFCADIEFVEAIVRSGQIDLGYCLMATPDSVFWTDSGRGSAIHNSFRSADSLLTGVISKPTGVRDTCVVIEGAYSTSNAWSPIPGNSLFKDGRFLLVEVPMRLHPIRTPAPAAPPHR